MSITAEFQTIIDAATTLISEEGRACPCPHCLARAAGKLSGHAEPVDAQPYAAAYLFAIAMIAMNKGQHLEAVASPAAPSQSVH